MIAETVHAAEFLISESHGYLSRENATLASGQNLQAGSVLHLASGKYTELVNPFDSADAVLFQPANASAGDAKCIVIVRKAEVLGSRLAFNAGLSDSDKRSAMNQLTDKGVDVR